MSMPTNFYSQQASLLPQGLQSLMSSGQLNPMPMAQAMQQQQPAIQAFQAQQQAPSQQQFAPLQQAPNYNQMAQMAAPIYTPPPPPPAPAPVAAPVAQQPLGRQPLVRPWQTNSGTRLEIQ